MHFIIRNRRLVESWSTPEFEEWRTSLRSLIPRTPEATATPPQKWLHYVQSSKALYGHSWYLVKNAADMLLSAFDVNSWLSRSSTSGELASYYSADVVYAESVLCGPGPATLFGLSPNHQPASRKAVFDTAARTGATWKALRAATVRLRCKTTGRCFSRRVPWRKCDRVMRSPRATQFGLCKLKQVDKSFKSGGIVKVRRRKAPQRDWLRHFKQQLKLPN